jgi:lipoprotein-releasing system permease protein
MRSLHWFIARHYLGSSRGRGLLSLITWIALGGITVGVTALIVVTAVMAGMQNDLREKILESTPHVYVLQQGTALRMNDWQTTRDSIMSVDGVVGAAPFVLSSVVIRNKAGYPASANLYGISVDTVGTTATDMERQILQGVLDLEPTESGVTPILMGSGLADQMLLFEGDSVLVIAMENLRTDMFGGLVPTIRQFEVTGTFTTGMYEYDTKNVYTTLADAQELLGLGPGDVSGIGVRTRDAEMATEVAEEIQNRVGFGYSVVSWITWNRALFSALKLEKIAMTLILSLIVVVAAFNIVSTLVMVVADRTREIGILRAMGMTQKGILRVFVMQGLWIGGAGTVAGAGSGLFLCWLLDRYQIIKIPPDVYFVDHLPVSLQPMDLVGIVSISITISFLATLYPAYRASRLEPVEAIRHE